MRWNRISWFFLLVVLFLLTAGNGWTQEIVFLVGNEFGVGARALGMGGAQIAVTEDYSATYWNPAALALVRRMEFQGSLSHLITRDDATFSTLTTSTDAGFTKLNSLGFVFPVPTYRGSLVFAAGFNRVRSFDSNFSFSWFNPTPGDSVTQTWDEMDTGGLNNWVLAGAIDVSPNLSLGGSLNFWKGSDDYEWTFREEDNLDIYTFRKYDTNDRVNTDLSAFNIKLGGLYRATSSLRFGLTLATPVTFEAKEDWSTGDRTVLDTNTTFDSTASGVFDYEIQSPFAFGFGASLSFANLLVGGDAEYSDWSQIKYKTEPPLRGVSKAEANRNIRENYQATTRYRLGAEFTLPRIGMQLRAGYALDPSPLKNALEDEDKKFITFGAGFLLDKQVKFDLAWTHGWWSRTSGPLSADVYTITEKLEVNHFLATMAFRF